MSSLPEISNRQLLSSFFNLEELYEKAPCGYLSFLPDGSIVKINTTMLTWLEFTQAEIIDQKKFKELISKGGQIHYEMFFRPMIRISGFVNEMSYDLVRKDGSLLPVLITGTTIKNEDGTMLAVNLAVLDNTDRKKYEQELLLSKRFAEAEKKRFEYIAELVPEMVWSADHTGRIDYCNGHFFEYFNVSLEELTPLLMLSKIHKSDRNLLLNTWSGSSESGANFRIELRLKNRQGRYEWHVINAFAHKNEEGNVVKWFGSCHNIHIHKNALEEKDDFISIASHELKNPLTSLKGCLQILEQTDLPEQSRLFVQKALSGINNLSFLVSSLLDITTINTGELQLTLSRFSLLDTMAECVEQSRYSYRNYDIQFNYDDQFRYMVMADKNRIIQVITNLISNAVKYSPDTNKVIARLNKTNEASFMVEIEDFGIGIAAEKQGLIFEKYYRIHDKRQPLVKGLGLGLYIIQNIMINHKSKIYLKSKLNGGSIFYFSLPESP